LDNGPSPIYIKWSSISSRDSHGIRDLVLKAIETSKQRAIISARLDQFHGLGITSFIFILDKGMVTHDGLFEHVSCVVHSGDAEVTASALKHGKLMVINLNYGDQPFWGEILAKAGLAPKTLPLKTFTAEAPIRSSRPSWQLE